MSVTSGSVTSDVHAARFRISDPRPSYCAACFQGAQDGLRFVDLDAAIDRGTLADEHGWVLDGIDDLHLCEACVRDAAQVLALRPELHARQTREIRRLELENEHWRAYVRELEESLAARPVPVVNRRARTRARENVVPGNGEGGN